MRLGMRLDQEDVDRIKGGEGMAAFQVNIINGVVNIIQLCILFLRRCVIEQGLHGIGHAVYYSSRIQVETVSVDDRIQK